MFEGYAWVFPSLGILIGIILGLVTSNSRLRREVRLLRSESVLRDVYLKPLDTKGRGSHDA